MGTSELPLKEVLDILSDDECLVLRKSRKTSWYDTQNRGRSHKYCDKCVQKKSNKEDPTELLIDTGYRSKERPAVTDNGCGKPIDSGNRRQSPKSARIQVGRNNSSNNLIGCNKNKQTSNICVSEDALAHTLRLAVIEKSMTVLAALCGQLRNLDEKTKSKVLSKLTFDERLVVLKTLYSPPKMKQKKNLTTVLNSPKQSKNELTSTHQQKPDSKPNNRKPPDGFIRKSFSFLEYSPKQKATEINYPNVDIRSNRWGSERNSKENDVQEAIQKFYPNNNSPKQQQQQQKYATKMVNQINELQKENGNLTSRLKELISQNYKLEKMLENERHSTADCQQMKGQIEKLAHCHDNIIDNVYQAYSQLTRSLRNLKFNNKEIRHSSVSPIRSRGADYQGADVISLAEKARSLSVNSKRNTINRDAVYENNNNNNNITTDLLDNYFAERKKRLTTERDTTENKIYQLQETLTNEEFNSAAYKKYKSEKNILEQHKKTLQNMIDAL